MKEHMNDLVRIMSYLVLQRDFQWNTCKFQSFPNSTISEWTLATSLDLFFEGGNETTLQESSSNF